MFASREAPDWLLMVRRFAGTPQSKIRFDVDVERAAVETAVPSTRAKDAGTTTGVAIVALNTEEESIIPVPAAASGSMDRSKTTEVNQVSIPDNL